MIKITKLASKYIYNLCYKKNNFCLKIENNSNIISNFSIFFYKNELINKNDYLIYNNKFFIYIEYNYLKYIKNLKIDIQLDSNLNENLIFNFEKNIYEIEKKINLISKINIFINKYINYFLSKHNGKIKAVKIINNNCLLIKFYKACNGCKLVNNTLNNFIDKNIKEKFPEILFIKDITEHKENIYTYKSE